MAVLRIALRNVMQRGEAHAAALADVSPIGSGTRLRGVVIPVAGSSPKEVIVTPGRYLIRTVLPSGEMVDEEATAVEGTPQDVVLGGDVTPHEWLGWQRFSPTKDALWETFTAPTTHVAARLVMSRGWEPLHGQAGPTPIERSDGMVTIFEVERLPIQPTRHAGTRDWPRACLIVERLGRRDAIALPAPWGEYDQSTIQVAVPHQLDLPLSITIQDPALGPLLGFVAAGSVANAARLLTGENHDNHHLEYRLLEMLAAKSDNPYAAAVAGYILLSTSRGDSAFWHDWIENLANWFVTVPDGAILAGWLALRRRDRNMAARRFSEAIGRGLPVVSGVLRVLHEGILQLGHDIDLAQAQRVHEAMARADMLQPFVTLRYEDHA